MIKKPLYCICKWLGCFYLARRLTRHGLRILAYHGSALCDEQDFRPLLFIDNDLFRQRMQYLVRHCYPVLSLDDAVERLRTRDLPECATVITIDDGFYSTWEMAIPVVAELKLPATIYVTTYYCLKSNPVFRLVIQYMFWKTTVTKLDLNDLGIHETGESQLPNTRSVDDITWRIISYAENRMNEVQRVQLCEKLGKRLNVDYSEIVRKRFLNLMTKNEIREASQAGVDIQLHTHRHNLPRDPDLVGKEIRDNRAVLEPLLGRKLHHFCYPSGIYFEDHRRPLADAGVVSATTCDPGLNYTNTPPLALHRFLDGNNISWVEFEAEMSGFSELLRNMQCLVARKYGRIYRRTFGRLIGK